MPTAVFLVALLLISFSYWGGFIKPGSNLNEVGWVVSVENLMDALSKGSNCLLLSSNWFLACGNEHFQPRVVDFKYVRWGQKSEYSYGKLPILSDSKQYFCKTQCRLSKIYLSPEFGLINNYVSGLLTRNCHKYPKSTSSFLLHWYLNWYHSVLLGTV